MNPLHHFSNDEKQALFDALSQIKSHPYDSYNAFTDELDGIINSGKIPAFFHEICHKIKEDRTTGKSSAHVLRNCPVDADIPELDQEDPFKDKLAKKKTFVGEAFLALFSKLTATPLLAYGNRFEGSFFADVIAVNKYSGYDSQFGDTELAYHNDRSAHEVRADFVTLLGTRCPQNELIFTNYIDGKDILEFISPEYEAILREAHYYTPFDIHSLTTMNVSESIAHPIIEGDSLIRYRDSWTIYTKDAPEKAKEALIAFRYAMTRATKTHHRMQDGDLFSFGNQRGLHSREHMEIVDKDTARTRWLLKTYSFKDKETAEKFTHRYKKEAFGCVDD
ncbi:TauD/TfdA family dioxygenase [Fangia hongkongensis]|uniref:TauD/TfdA family dioxygenase n=1 Tax=Fangia hongkongensis TaxID=270495 RepID=UPI000367C02B|nr:TauD/TfdA family dioxygenase [Fangia hongkongensis]MBK2125298.1 TauD/TfdA family dioxygenase [Fangia hongkongensis]